jgi:prevent-host-death family protein
MSDLSMTEARKVLGSLVRRAASTRERVTITDHGQPAAVLVSALELAELEEALALAEYRAGQAAARAAGSAGVSGGVPHHQVRAVLGLPRA